MFGEKLRTARINAGYTQQQVADLLKIDRPTYNKIEQDKVAPKYDDLPKLANMLKVDIKLLQKYMCAHPKTECAHTQTSKSSTTTYKLTVPLDRAKFPKLTKSNLKKAGYVNLEQFIEMAYCQLEKQLINEK